MEQKTSNKIDCQIKTVPSDFRQKLINFFRLKTKKRPKLKRNATSLF